ncbi:MAG: hypothetical protein ACK5LY_04650 [Lachnospirales bacterium]
MKDVIKRFTQNMIIIKYDFDDFDLDEYSANFQKKLEIDRHNKKAKKYRRLLIFFSVILIILSVLLLITII